MDPTVASVNRDGVNFYDAHFEHVRDIEAFLHDQERWILAKLEEWSRRPRPVVVRGASGDHGSHPDGRRVGRLELQQHVAHPRPFDRRDCGALGLLRSYLWPADPELPQRPLDGWCRNEAPAEPPCK